MKQTKQITFLLLVGTLFLIPFSGYSQKINVNYQTTSIIQVLSDLEKQSHYSFVYQKQVLNDAPLITCSMSNATLTQILDKICSDAGLSYEFFKETIVLSKGKNPNNTDLDEPSKITGVVTALDDGTPVPFANVFIKGTPIGTTAGENGAFVIENVPDNAVLTISSIGYLTQNVTIGSRKVINVQMKSDQEFLEETIIVAYGSAKKGSITGSAAVVDKAQLEKRVLTNVGKSIEGQVAGVMTTSGSGQPGEGSSIVVRGYGSINASKTPLYVVDGIPFDGGLNSINPSDIESITVLKDASSGALYGARGANGVILITTKKGKVGAVNITYNGTVGWSNPSLNSYDRVSQKDYVQLTYESLRNTFYFSNNYSWAEAEAMARANLSNTLGGEIYNPFKNYTWDTIIGSDGYVQDDAVSSWNEDWLEDGIINHNALRQEHVVTVTGGTDRFRALLSLGYLNEDGYTYETGFKRYSARVNLDTDINSWFSAGLNISIANSVFTGLMNSGNSYGNQFYYAQLAGPIYPIYEKDESGNSVIDELGEKIYDYGDTRPCWPGTSMVGLLFDDDHSQENMNESVRTYIRIGSDSDDAGFLKGLKLTVNFGGDNRDAYETLFNNMYNGNYVASNGRIYKYSKRTTSYTFNQLLTYNREFNNHTIDILAGHEYYNYDYHYIAATKTNLVDGIVELRPATSNIDADSYSNEYNIESYLTRLNYNYDGKYYISASLRRDGSSRFYKDNRWGNFWSVGANWRVTNENFMSQVPWVDNLNIKASYGLQGNDDLSTYYAWQSFYGLSWANEGATGALISSLENKDVTWEKSANFNVGFDAKLFKGKLSLSGEWYNRKTTDMLLNYPMALSTGFSGYDANAGSMVNKGIEFSVTGVLMDRKNVFWKASVLGTSINNKILKLTTESPSFVSGQHIYEEGRPMYTFYMTRFAGVNPETGAEQYYAYESLDENGNAVGEYVTEDYSVANACRYYLGSRMPKISGSIGTDLVLFNCVDLSILTTYSLGGSVYDVIYKELVYPTQYARAISSDVLDRWQNPGDITDEPRMRISTASSSVSDRFLIDASYFTIKNITIGYTLPSKISKIAGISKIRIYASLDNLKTFNHLNGMDPQYSLGGTTTYAYAPNKTTIIGLNLNF